jgi:hypothetical protein
MTPAWYRATIRHDAPDEGDEWTVRFEKNDVLIERPAFRRGDGLECRAALPEGGTWRWSIPGTDSSGEVEAAAFADEASARGPLRMSPGGRGVVRQDGSPFLVVADTAWALPFRATIEEARAYADDRAGKGFNTALLMSVQPDMRAEGPDDRAAVGGFARAFHDLPDGTLRNRNEAYFDHLDELIDVLLSRGIVPVWQPVFHGFGWKGLNVLGPVVPPADYAAYCRYLVARYGDRPAIWLLQGDGGGEAEQPAIAAAGEAVEACDAYHQPTGLHYGPQHLVARHAEADWCDFHWCQTGHDGGDDVWSVAHFAHQLRDRSKACANGEPTYERIGHKENATGWWQGDNAWQQLMAGGTMGVVYGAGSVWPWVREGEEDDWPRWCYSPGFTMKQALGFEGSSHVGRIAGILSGLDLSEVAVRRDLAGGRRCLAKPGELYVCYLPGGGGIPLFGRDCPLRLTWHDPRTGDSHDGGELAPTDGNPWRQQVNAPDVGPWVLIARV